MRGVPASWALALLVCCVPSSQGEARLDLFSAPQGTCQRCTCIDCACAIEFPECRKCQDSQRVAQLVVDEADGLCRRARVRHLHPHVDKQVLAPLTFMAVVCARGLWLGADAATKDECDRKAASLAASFERGERDANTQRCLPGGGGYMRYACGDDDEAVAAATSAADATQPLSALPGLEEASSQALRSRVQKVFTALADMIPVVAPVVLLATYAAGDTLPGYDTAKGKALVALFAATIFTALVWGGALS